MKIEDLEKALQYFVIAVPENKEQAKAYFWARKGISALRSVSREQVEMAWRGEWGIGGTEMTDREKMIDLIINAKKSDPETGSFTEYLADFLLGYGIKLPDPTPQPGKPLTLDQLREMDGQPVWIVEYPDWGHWELSEDANDYIVDRNLDFYGMKHDDPDGRYGLHKLGWLAYSYPPAQQRWIPVSERLPEDEDDGETVLAVVFGKPHKNITLHHAIMTAEYFYQGGWLVNEYPEWENPTVTHWMPLPEPPEEG